MPDALRIGHLSTFYHTSTILMAGERTGTLKGIVTEWRLFGTGPAIVKAFQRGELDLAYIGLPPAVIGIDGGVKITCVAGGHIEGTVISGKSRYRGYPEIDDLGQILTQFSGLTIGVPGKGSIHDVILSACLNRFGLAEKITVRNFQWADMVTEAVVKEEVAAAVGTPALAVAVNRYAGGKVLYPPSKLWPNNPSYGILVDSGFLRESRELVERFLIAHEEVTSFMRQSPEEASRIISRYVGFVDEGFVLDTLKISPKYCAQLTEEFISATMDFVRILRKLGYIKRPIPAAEIFDTSLISRIHPEQDHYGEGFARL